MLCTTVFLLTPLAASGPDTAMPPLPAGPVFLHNGLLIPAALTILIETPLFALCLSRKRRHVALFAGVNLVSNLLLNEWLGATALEYTTAVVWGELTVLALEYALCATLMDLPRLRLFATLVLTNAGSLLLGLMLMRFGLL